MAGMENSGPVQAGKSDQEFCSATSEELFAKFYSSPKGLSDSEAKNRLAQYGHNELAKKEKRNILFQFLSNFFSPLIAVMLIIALASLYFGERTEALIVLTMAFVSVVLSFVQEHNAGKEAEKLRGLIPLTATVVRNGVSKEVPMRDIVPGDVIDLYAGDMIPADLRIFSCKDLFINQSSFTGESFPVEKSSAPLSPKSASPQELANIAFMGSSVVSGTAYGLVVKTGLSTRFGELSRKLTAMHVETSFDRGVNAFTWLMIRFMVLLVAAIFAINAILKGDVAQALLFSLAVAVGLTPQMLPMMIAVNLSKGAITMAKKQVIVKRLNSIQNFGAMDVLCTDKTGTLTLNTIVLERHLDVAGRESEDVLALGYVNSFYQTGLKNLLDQAILKHEKLAVQNYKKIDEIPFDFSRKVMSVVVATDGAVRIITKGAPEAMIKRCTRYELDNRVEKIESHLLSGLQKEYAALSSSGFRVLALAYKDVEKKTAYTKDDEQDLILKGYLAFLDPPKPTVKKAIQTLKKLGVGLKILTGDNDLITRKICADVGIEVKGILAGEHVDKMSDAELGSAVESTSIFAMLSPSQKERIIRALQKNGHTVGYLGDGINDAPSLKASDVGISVSNAVDIARESADIILLRKSLTVLGDGIVEGRKVFGNITKYIRMGASSNLGNMISMTGASLFLPFLPMAPIQILLNNFLYDMSQVAIPADEVDREYITAPRPWDISRIRNFMLIVGPVSSLFDFITFFALLFFFHANESFFHTGWFLESLITQTLVIHVIRTGKIPFLESMPSRLLLASSLVIVIIGLLLPFSPIAGALGFVQMPPAYFVFLGVLVLAYLLLVQLVKGWFVKKYGY